METQSNYREMQIKHKVGQTKAEQRATLKQTQNDGKRPKK